MRWFKRKINNESYNGRCYAITQGKYKGNFFVYMQHDSDTFNFLSLPDMDCVEIPADVFKQGIQSKIVDHIEVLPDNIYNLCKAQYNEARTKNNINRLKQSATPSSMDSGECES